MSQPHGSDIWDGYSDYGSAKMTNPDVEVVRAYLREFYDETKNNPAFAALSRLEEENERLRANQPKEVVMHGDDKGNITWNEPLPRVIAITDALFAAWMRDLARLRRIEGAAREYLRPKESWGHPGSGGGSPQTAALAALRQALEEKP